MIEKAVKAFERIDGVDTELAERLVEQGILSFDDLSVMEIADLVNTIEGLTEEQAMELVARAETLAEEQTEELPRRKGSRAGVARPGRVGGRGAGRRGERSLRPDPRGRPSTSSSTKKAVQGHAAGVGHRCGRIPAGRRPGRE